MRTQRYAMTFNSIQDQRDFTCLLVIQLLSAFNSIQDQLHDVVIDNKAFKLLSILSKINGTSLYRTILLHQCLSILSKINERSFTRSTSQYSSIFQFYPRSTCTIRPSFSRERRLSILSKINTQSPVTSNS